MIFRKFLKRRETRLAVAVGFMLSLTGCGRDGMLSLALEEAGDNRGEIESVLARYEGDPEKREAAEWLVSNMTGLTGMEGDGVRTLADSILARRRVKEEADSLWGAIKAREERAGTVSDLRTVTGAFLADNIDAAFEAWRESPWKGDVDFGRFKSYVLPYRVEHELLRTGWRDSIRREFAPLLKGVADPVRAFEIIRRRVFSQPQERQIECPHRLDVVAYRNYFSKVCMERCIYFAGVCRAMGLPVAVDNCGRWANYSDNVHSWVALVLPSGTYTVVDEDTVARRLNKIDASGYVLSRPLPEGYPYDGSFRKRVLKVWRSSFGLNPVENHPAFSKSRWLRHPRSVDVSAEYGLTDSVEVRPDIATDHLWLCTHSLESGWVAQAHATVKDGRAVFRNIGDSAMVLPMAIVGGKETAAGRPFYLSDGRLVEIRPDTTKRIHSTLTRKYPISPGQLNGYNDMPGSRIVAGVDSGFRNPVTLHVIRDVPVFHNSFTVTVSGRYRCLWVEAEPPSRHYVDFLKAYDREGRLIEGEGKRALDFGRRVEIARIDYFPRSDGNFVEPGHDYELMWWDTDKWSTLGKRHSEGYALDYDNVPSGALLLLHDHTAGKEERPFTLENGRQVWW